MPESANLTLLSSASGQMASEVFENTQYSLAVIQVSGSFTGLSVVAEGRVSPDAPWEPLGALDMGGVAAEVEGITHAGIYEIAIDGIAQIRFYVASIEGGQVSVGGVFFRREDRSVYPGGSAGIRFGNPSLFVKGVAERVFMEPSTGNIVGYDRCASDAAVRIDVNLAEIAGGMGNRLIGVLPDTVRISGTYTSEAFSLETRRLITGGRLAWDAVCPVCEILTGDSSGVLTVSGEAAHAYEQDERDFFCRCYVRETDGRTERGEAHRILPETGEICDFDAEDGVSYEVTYYTHRASAESASIPDVWNPVLMTVQTRFAVYGRQGRHERQGVLRGWLYFIVPRAVLNADAGLDGSQTDNGGTDGSWIALPNKRENMPYCLCGDDVTPVAYYVYVPCGDAMRHVTDIVLTGGGITVPAGKSARLPVKLVMDDGGLVQPEFSALNYASSDDAVATVNQDGTVYGESSGTAHVTVWFVRENGDVLEAVCPVTVTGTRNAVGANPGNVTVV